MCVRCGKKSVWSKTSFCQTCVESVVGMPIDEFLLSDDFQIQYRLLLQVDKAIKKEDDANIVLRYKDVAQRPFKFK